MKWEILAFVAVVSVIVIATALATAHMYSYNGIDNSQNSEFRSSMQEEMNEILELQQKYQSGQITQEQYQQGLQEHWQDMQEIHNQYGAGCPMAFRNGMMGYGMMGW